MNNVVFDSSNKTTIEEDKVFASPKNLNISSIREKLGLIQPEFADILGIPLHHLKVWEGGNVEPPRPVMLLLRVADRWPETFIDSLLDY